jgi:hypothetical protein
VKNGDWPHVVDAKACLYGGLMASLLSTSLGSLTHASQSSGNWVHHMREGVMIWELIDKMGWQQKSQFSFFEFFLSLKSLCTQWRKYSIMETARVSMH